MGIRRVGKTSLSTLAFVAFGAALLYGQGQAVNAQLDGTVTDPNDAGIPAAKITLSNPETGFTRQFETSDTGHFVFSLIPPGQYELRVEKEGFNTYVQPNIVLAVGQQSTVNPKLDIGSVSQTVEVTGSAPVLETGNANVGSEVSTKQAVELKVNIRNVFGLVALDSSVNNSQQNQALNPPGSQGNVDQDISFFNFGRAVRHDSISSGWPLGRCRGLGWDSFVPSVDELQEFKIQTNSFSPQYGWSMGNVINAVTKSGTRSFHGDVFEFLRNNNFDANNFFNNLNGLPRPQFKRNQFGVTAGGPVFIPKLYRQREKTFIFGAYEGLRQQTPTTLLATVPTDAQRNGDFSQTGKTIFNPFTTRLVNGNYVRDPFPNNKIPANLIDPVAQKLLQYYPHANRPGDPGTGANNLARLGLPTNSDQYTIRVDHNVSDRQHLFVRWSQKRQFKQLEGEFFGADNPGGNGTLAPDNRWDGGLGYSFAISPTLVMVANLGWGRWVEGRVPQGVPFQPSSLGLPSFLDNFGGPGAFPSVNISGEQNLGSGTLNATPREARTYSVDFTKNSGRHTFSAGFTGITFMLNTANSSWAIFNFGPDFTQGPNPTAALSNSGYGFASFLLGTAENSGAGGASGISLTANAAFSKKYFGWYFNDDWKVNSKLTLNLGLRYDIQTSPTDRFNRLSYFSLKPNPISSQVGQNLPGSLVYTGNGNPRSVYDPQYTNFAPRVGLTYAPLNKLVFRAGFGMFYTPAMEFGDYQGLSLNGFSQTTPYVATLNGVTPANLLSNPFPTGLLQPPGKSADGATNVGQSINAIIRNRPTPYVEQWTANLQYEIAPETVSGCLHRQSWRETFVRLHVGDEPASAIGFSAWQCAADAREQPVLRHHSERGTFGTHDSVWSVAATIPGIHFGRECADACGLFVLPRASSFRHTAVQQRLAIPASYTWSKYLTNTEGPEGWTQGAAQSVRNWYDTSLEKSLNTR